MESEWKYQENKESGLFHRHILVREAPIKGVYRCPNDKFNIKIECGLHPVIYGWRVRAGIIPEDEEYCQYYDMDICCGSSRTHIAMIQGMVLFNIEESYFKIISSYNKLLSLSVIFPNTTIKPIVNDENFPKWIDICEGYKPVKITSDDLNKWRSEYIKRVYD